MAIEQSVHDMHKKFTHDVATHKFFSQSEKNMKKFLTFRMLMQLEETGELAEAIGMPDEVVEAFSALADLCRATEPVHPMDFEEIIDAFVDTVVFSTGSLDALFDDVFMVDSSIHEVMSANMQKELGVKPGRPNPFGLPDLCKPEGWVPPDMSRFAIFLKSRCNF